LGKDIASDLKIYSFDKKLIDLASKKKQDLLSNAKNKQFENRNRI